MSTFDSTKFSLPQILTDITSGKIQLPDFQRGWVWDDAHVRSLLVSIARSFPVGAVMMLDTGGDIRFQVRPVENVTFEGIIPEPERLILDGQQRLTSLTQVLSINKPVNTFNDKGKKVSRCYYIDIELALEEGRLEDAFKSVPADKIIRENFDRDIKLDLSDTEKEVEAFHFPCAELFDTGEWEQALHKARPEKFATFLEFRRKVVDAFKNYQLPAITLGKATSKEAVCLVFEKVNTGGVSLTVFELVTATFAADGHNLRDDWYGSELREIVGIQERLRQEPVLASVQPEDFLQSITLLQTYEKRQADKDDGKTGKLVSAVSAKRSAVLSLTLADYKKWSPQVEKGFMLTAQFLRKEYIFNLRELPYRTQLVPLATVLSEIGERWREPRIYDRLSRWYWSGILGELYGSAVETRMANDFEELIPWLTSDFDDESYSLLDGLPRTVDDASFQESRLDSLRSRLSAAYKGLNVLIIRENAQDWFWKETIEALNHEEMILDIHHIFPKKWCEDRNIKPAIFNSVVNKTPISYKANRMIGGNSPSNYLSKLQNHPQVALSDTKMDELLSSHQISGEHLRTDNFDAFYKERKEALTKLISKAMGKPVQRDHSQKEEAE